MQRFKSFIVNSNFAKYQWFKFYMSFIFVIVMVIWFRISFRVQLWAWETVKIIFFIQSFHSLFPFSSEFEMSNDCWLFCGWGCWPFCSWGTEGLGAGGIGYSATGDAEHSVARGTGAEDAENSVAGVVVHFGTAFLVDFVNFHPSPPCVFHLVHIWGSVVPMCRSL